MLKADRDGGLKLRRQTGSSSTHLGVISPEAVIEPVGMGEMDNQESRKRRGLSLEPWTAPTLRLFGVDKSQ